MPGRKRGREDAEEEGDISKQSVEEFETKRGRGIDGESPIRPNSRASDKGKSCGTCRNGHDLVLVPREVRKLEKDVEWSCDSNSCKLTWDEDRNASYLDRQRYRCVHYMSGGKCNFDICGDCVGCKEPAETRRSSREIKPKFTKDGEWQISPKFQTKRTSPEKPSPASPKRSSRRSAHNDMSRSRSPMGGGSSTPLNRSTRARRGSVSPTTPLTAAGRSPRSINNVVDTPLTESDSDEGKRVESPPFYPSNHVRFSPSVKNGSPYGEKRRSSRHGMRSYLQSLPSEDEQSEFNRQYSRDLRKRQARKLSEDKDDQVAVSKSRRGRSSRDDQEPEEEEEGEDAGVRRTGRTTSRRVYNEEDGEEEEEEEDAPVRRGQRQERKVDYEEEEHAEAPVRRGGRPRRPVQVVSEGEEEEEPSVGRRGRRSTRRRISESQSEHENAPPPRRGRRRVASESEEDQSLASRRQSLRSKLPKEDKKEESEDEDEADPTVTEASVRRRSSRRSQLEDNEDADTESGVDKGEDEREGEMTEETEEDDYEEAEEGEHRRTSRRRRAPVNRFHYDAPAASTRERRDSKLLNMDKYCSDEEFNGNASPKKKKYSLRQKRANTTRYQDEFPGKNDTSTKDQGLIRRSAMTRGTSDRYGGGSGGGRTRSGRNRNERSRRQRTGDSSSPSSSSCSDEEAFERRKGKRMTLEREKLRPLNMTKKDVTKAIFKDREKVGASMADVQPMEMDMGVTFDSVGGMKEYVNSLKEMVMFPLLYPEMFDKFNIVPPRGVLFYGPPGTGKTLLARALACECSNENRKVAFFMRKGADCLSKWIGESERQLRLLFDQAYQMRPSIIFFDEIDGLAPVRSSRQDQIHSSIVSTLLALMDGLDNRGEIVIIGATNRIENIDPALRRPGRFDRELRFSLPCRSTRKEILGLHTKSWNPPVSAPLMNFLSAKTLGYCGADLKGLCTEAALNALRRRYPQVYQSNQKLQLDLDNLKVEREDFGKALRKIVPSTHRVEDKILSPLPKHIKSLVEPTYLNIVASIKRLFPHSAAGKGALLPQTLTHRPRLMIIGESGQGQTTYIGPALLHFMEKFPCQKLDIPALFSNSARTPEEACTQIVHSARRTMPGVLYIPHLCMLWNTITDTVRATLTTLLSDLPPTAPLLILAVCDQPYGSLSPEVQTMFLPYYREVYKLENPGENERREYFRPLIVSCSALPPKPKPEAAPVQALPVLPVPECRKLTAREEKRLKRKEDALLRELRIFLRDIWAKINRESKFFMFRAPVNTEEVDDYLDYVSNPMDFEKMHIKLDDGEYRCAQDFLNDIDLIAENATAYNCDLAFETNRIICHRARALQDFAYAMVKAEMDTDFEDECKEIVQRRVKVTEKLKKIDKDSNQTANNQSPSKMQDLLAIVSTACEVCGSRKDDSNMLLCDGCDAGYHTYCVEPPITEVPEGDWFCPKCVEKGVDQLVEDTPTVEEGGSGGGGSGGQRKKRRRRSKWASGVADSGRRKLPPKKRIFDSGDEKEGGEEESQDHEDQADNQQNEQNEDQMDTEEPVAGPSEVPDSLVVVEREPSALAPSSREEPPTEPTGVRIDGNKLMMVHNEMVRTTDGFTVEKLERAYAILSKVVRQYKTKFDRTNLPTDLLAELEGIKAQERSPDHTARIRR